MKITITGEYDFNLTPENEDEDRELDEMWGHCISSPVVVLTKMLYDETGLWQSLMLSQQILSDLLDYANIHKEN
jgi:hypothetical protein